jgi:lysylphosphatidylglycerol synthetase-like protein (DUF2156 family)
MQTDTTCDLDIVRAVRKYGGQASDAILDSDCKQFILPGIEGFIGYKTASDCAVIFGDPITAETDFTSVLDAFFSSISTQFHNTIIITASKTLKELTFGKFVHAAVQFGNELHLDPFDDPLKLTGEKASLVRRKVRHASKEGVTVQEYLGNDPELEKEFEELAVSWRNSRKGVQIHTSQIKIFENRLGKRWFYAVKDGKVIGVLLLNKTESTDGFLLNRYLVLPHAPGGVPETLVIAVLNALREEGCHHLSFGSAINLSTRNIEGFSPVQSWIAEKTLQLSDSLFKLSQRQSFWEKFHPESEPSYILFQNPKIGLKEIFALCKALNVSL